jgi:molecular chaperone DnaK (HSP70)
MGEAALTKFKTNFRDTVTYVTRFLGLRPERSEEERKFVMARVVTTEGGRLAFRVRYLGEEQTMLPEQVAAAFLTKLLNIL